MWLLLLLLLLLAAAAAAAAGELWVNFLVEDTQVPPVLPAHVGVDGRLVQLSKTRRYILYVNSIVAIEILKFRPFLYYSHKLHKCQIKILVSQLENFIYYIILH